MKAGLLSSAGLALVLALAAPLAAAPKKCDASCDAECQQCCTSWQLVAVCGERAAAAGSIHYDAEAAARVAKQLNAAAASCQGDACSAVRFACDEGGAVAEWQPRCSGNPIQPAPSSEVGRQRRLIAAELAAIDHVKAQLEALVQRPDLKKDAARRANRLLERLKALPAELAQADARLAAGEGVAAARELTTKASRELQDAAKLGKDQRAIDPNYEARLRREAEERARAERAKEEAEKKREAELLAKKKAEAARIAREIEKKEQAARAAQQTLKDAVQARSAARGKLLGASKAADAALLSCIKFSSQRNLSRTGRSRIEQARARLEAHKRELGKTFEELSRPGGDDPSTAKRNAQRLERKADELARKIERERQNVERIIKDKNSVTR